jgi:hypothetical protein
MIFAYYFSPTTPGAASFTVDVTPAVRLGSITGLVGEAELGAVGEGNIVLDDPLSTVGYLSDGIVGLKQLYINETACPSGNQRLWTGYIGDRRYHRGQGDSLITGVARKIDVTLVDLNSFLSFRVFAPTADDPTSDFVRPAETDLERVDALLTTVDFLSTTLFDIGYIPTTGGVDLDANDYTGQRPADVLNDCAQASGRNFWVGYDETGNQLFLWYDRWNTDGSATLAYDSALRLTNVLSEHDGSTTFAIQADAVEVLDPSRVVSAVYLPFDNETDSPAYRTFASTANTFAWRDSIAPSVQVKTLTKANALANRYLSENSTEDARISCTVQLPSAKVTGIHEGMRLQVHFSHLPLVNEDFTWTRVLQRTIRQDVETSLYYWLDLELSPIAAQCVGATEAGFRPPLYAFATNAEGNIWYSKAGGEAGPDVPDPDFVGCSEWNFPSYHVSDGLPVPPDGFEDGVFGKLSNTLRINVVGAGTLTIYTCSFGSSGHFSWQLQHNEPEPIGTVNDDDGDNVVAGTTLVIAVVADVFCAHWVDLREPNSGEDGGASFGGFSWTPA